MFDFELRFLKLLEGMRTIFLNTLFEGITTLGEETLLIVLLAVAFFMFDKHFARKLFYITVLSLNCNCAIKNFVQLPRPFADGKITAMRAETATGYSFPSGHTQNFATWSFALALHFKKHWMSCLAAILTLLMGFSRMYLGVHYPSDVIVGMLLGFALAALGNYLHNKVKNQTALYAYTLLILTPFAIYFLCTAEALFADFFKAYGLLAGFVCSTYLEEKYVSLGFESSWVKKILRVVIAIVVALFIKVLLKKLFACENMHLSLLLDALRYFTLAFMILGVCPWLFKKLKL